MRRVLYLFCIPSILCFGRNPAVASFLLIMKIFDLLRFLLISLCIFQIRLLIEVSYFVALVVSVHVEFLVLNLSNSPANPRQKSTAFNLVFA